MEFGSAMLPIRMAFDRPLTALGVFVGMQEAVWVSGDVTAVLDVYGYRGGAGDLVRLGVDSTTFPAGPTDVIHCLRFDAGARRPDRPCPGGIHRRHRELDRRAPDHRRPDPGLRRRGASARSTAAGRDHFAGRRVEGVGHDRLPEGQHPGRPRVDPGQLPDRRRAGDRTRRLALHHRSDLLLHRGQLQRGAARTMAHRTC